MPNTSKLVGEAGMRLGLSVHTARSWNWYEDSQGSDKTGPLAGVPYDGKLTKADGKGLWWEGLDPQDLYAQNHAIGADPDAAYVTKFFSRIKDLASKSAHYPGAIGSVQMLGSSAKLEFARNENELTATIPENGTSIYANALKIVPKT